ncbi:hypothetical protein SAMN05216516_105187 [Izhakiella capsodis]|uniref:Uncharacterized protein n=1 Tax=Izhakiella capsodis TaxID=1367852 RepID=A0A1I4Y3H6_9GAMM|nr:hypothetical protein SAMN05216516_105187 [Izhakiella capsodis]
MWCKAVLSLTLIINAAQVILSGVLFVSTFYLAILPLMQTL